MREYPRAGLAAAPGRAPAGLRSLTHITASQVCVRNRVRVVAYFYDGVRGEWYYLHNPASAANIGCLISYV